MGGDKQHNEGGAKDDVQDNYQPQGQHKVKPPPSQEQIEINNQQQQTERSTVKKDALQLPDSSLPGKFSYVLWVTKAKLVSIFISSFYIYTYRMTLDIYEKDRLMKLRFSSLNVEAKKVNNIFLVFMLHLKPEKLVNYMSVTVIHICY